MGTMPNQLILKEVDQFVCMVSILLELLMSLY